MKVAAGGTIFGKSSQPCARPAAFRNFEIGILVAHLGFYPTGVSRVYLYRSIAQLVGEMDGKRVQGRLGGVVSKHSAMVNRRRRISVKR